MDDDCEAEPDWLERISECFTPEIALVSGRVIVPPKARRVGVCPGVAPEDVVFNPMESGLVPPPGFGLLGANMAVRRTAMDRAGAFDEYLGAGAPFQGSEEHELAHRLLASGAVLRSSSAPTVTHTYGYRYGVRSLYFYKRERLRGDGGAVGKSTLVSAPEGGLSVRSQVWSTGWNQLKTVKITPRRWRPFACSIS